MSGIKRHLMVLLAGMGVLTFLAGCGSGNDSTAAVVAQSNHSSLNSAPNPADIQPDIHTNVPPPQTTDVSADKFFEQKKIYDKFSPQLKQQIFKTYSTAPSPTVTPSQQVGTSQPVIFNTLLGPSTPTMYKIIGGVGGCDPKADFICLDSPEDGAITVQPGVDVIGKIDLTQLAVFGANDPVVVVSVFNNTSSGAISEVAIMPSEITASTDPNMKDAGLFSTSIGLGGGGKFTIVVSAYRATTTTAPAKNTTTSNDLVSQKRDVTRLEAPQIEFVEARPNPKNEFASTDKSTDPVSDGDTIKAQALNVKVKLTTVDAAGIVVKYEDFDDAGQLHSAVASTSQDTGERIGKVVLHPGNNKIVITAYSPSLNQALGKDAPPPSVLNFKVTNAGGTPQIKIFSPETEGLIEQTASDQQVDLKFCFTFLSSKYKDSSSTPAISNDCVTGALGVVPEVDLNGKKVETTDTHKVYDYDATLGTFTFHLNPTFGVNIFEIYETKKSSGLPPLVSGAFNFGVSVPLIKDGVIYQIKDLKEPNDIANFDKKNNFTKRGLNIDIDRSMIEGDVKKMVVKYVNNPNTIKLLLGSFSSPDNKPGYVCDEFKDPNNGKPGVSNGDTTINFVQDSFKMGTIDVTNVDVGSDGMLHVGVRINGMHGEADLRSAESNGSTFNGMDLGFVPITFSIAELDVNIGVAFPKKFDIDLNKDGHPEERSVLDIHQIDGVQFMSIKGDGPLGRPVYINSQRNPLAAGIELLDWQQGLLLTQFNTIMGGTILCGLENGLNNELSGALGKAVADLEKLDKYDANFQRLPMNFNLFGKAISLDVAYDLLKGDIKFDSTGIHIRNVPLRFNPGPLQLAQLAKDFSKGILGIVSRWKPLDEAEAAHLITNDDHNFDLQLSEDGINYALAAATWAGLLDLDLDANFYTQNKVSPIEDIAPMGSNKLTDNLDLNHDGKVDELDKHIPVLMRVRPNKYIPPMLTFLTQQEVEALNQEEQEFRNGGSGSSATPAPTASPSATKFEFDPSKQYFKLSLADLDLSIFTEESAGNVAGDTRTYCRKIWQDYQAMNNSGFCPMNGKVLVDDNDDPSDAPACDSSSNLVTLPRLNGPIISEKVANSSVQDATPVPVYRLNVGLIVYGYVKGVRHGKYAKDVLLDPAAPEKTVIHIGIVPNFGMQSAFITSARVVENHTDKPDEDLAKFMGVVLTGTLGEPCKVFNELRISVPAKFPADPKLGDLEPKDLLPDFNVKSIDLGKDPAKYPQAFIDDSHLYLDILAFAGLNFTDEVEPIATPGGQ